MAIHFSQRFLAGLAVLAAGWALAVCADESLEKRASWQQPARAEVKQAIDVWLTDHELDELTQTRLDVLWSDEAARAFDQDRLDLLAETIAMIHPETRAVIELCSLPQRPLVLPRFDFLDSEQTTSFVRDHLRLYLARWLAQQAMYDESLEMVRGLEPGEVVDPAALLFYQAVGHHRMLQRDECLQAVSRLLENKGQIPRRYETVAMLMESDIKPMQPDSLDEISRLMDDIERRLGFGRAGARVRQQEDEVIAKLDKMIEELEKQMQQQQASSAGGGGGAQGSSPMQDSNPAGGSGPGDVDPRRLGTRANWGNLPPKERQEALQQIAKGLPSHYREVIEEYFRKLARDGND
jgi:hypothetical protein